MKRLFLILCFALFCGVVFTGNVHAAQTLNVEGYPSITLTADHPYEYVIYKDTSGVTRAYVVYVTAETYDTPFLSFVANENQSYLYFKTNFKGSYAQYHYVNNPDTGVNTWILKDNTNYGYNVPANQLMSNTVAEYIQTSSKIELEDGTVVFPEPPTPALQKVIQEETTKAQGTILKAMTVIALCGVGCLALLMALPILSRVFSRYR